MSRYTVVWVASALDELAEEWLIATDGNAVTAAALAIDVALAVDALAMGIELSEGLRAFFSPPLRVLFTVRESDRTTEVLRVRRL